MKDNKNNSCEFFDRFLFCLNSLKVEINPKDRCSFDLLESRFSDLNFPLYIVKSKIQKANVSLNFFENDPVAVYLSRCLGHKINEKIFFKYPKFAVLYSLCILKDRWVDAEKFIVADDFASYLYSKYVIGGRLPEKMHTEIVMRTFLCKSFSIQNYFENIRVYKEKKCATI